MLIRHLFVISRPRSYTGVSKLGGREIKGEKDTDWQPMLCAFEGREVSQEEAIWGVLIFPDSHCILAVVYVHLGRQKGTGSKYEKCFHF